VKSGITRGLVVAAAFGVVLTLSACGGGGDELADQLSEATVAAVADTPTSTVADGSAADGAAGLRVTVNADPSVESMDSMSSSTTVASMATTLPLTTMASTALFETTASTASTATTMATDTSGQTSTTVDMTTTSSDGTGSTAMTSSTTATTPAPVVNKFPDVLVTRMATGEVVPFVPQVAGSKPVLVWFWLPG